MDGSDGGPGEDGRDGGDAGRVEAVATFVKMPFYDRLLAVLGIGDGREFFLLSHVERPIVIEANAVRAAPEVWVAVGDQAARVALENRAAAAGMVATEGMEGMEGNRSVWTIGRRAFFVMCSFALLFQLDCTRQQKNPLAHLDGEDWCKGVYGDTRAGTAKLLDHGPTTRH
jgi:hypothetical protein